MILTQKRILDILLQHLAALAIVAITAVILLPVKPYLSIQIVVLLFLLPVVLSTVLFGLTPGFIAAFAAFLTFNYLFLQPLHTLIIHDTRDLVTLIIFLGLAILISQLLGKAKDGIRLARRREWEATRMYELISSLVESQTITDFARDFAVHTLETFHGRQIVVHVFQKDGDEDLLYQLPEKIERINPADVSVKMRTNRGVEGEILLWVDQTPLSPEEFKLLQAYSSQGALSVERIRLTKDQTKARALEESDKLKTSLLNSVSHELRSPLSAIKASVSSLRSKSIQWETQDREDLLATIEEETDHLNLLVGHLLDMSRIESGALHPQLRWNSIFEILMGVVTKMRNQLADKKLDISIPRDLPLVLTDYVLIEQVFSNLLSNSGKYAPPNTTIQVSAVVEGEDLHTTVRNEGPPVPGDHLDRIFDKFYRVTAADRVTGTGLGLSICKGIIEAHHGKIWAENEPNHFVFHFTLPIHPDGTRPEPPQEIVDG